MDRFEQKTERSLEFFDDCFGKHEEFNVRVLIVEVFGEFSNTLCVRLRLELESFAFKKDFKFFVVSDDAIVHDGEFPAWI